MTAPATPQQLLLLADHLKLSLLERQRAKSLGLEANKQDGTISQSLQSLDQGLQQLESHGSQSDEAANGVVPLRKQYDELYRQYYGTAPPSVATSKPNDPALQADFEAAQSRPSQPRRSKSVRFRDDDDAEDAVDTANRAALFSEQQGYSDDPSALDQTDLSNQQIHTHHKQVLQDQDEQLNTLGQSIGRQRMLGIQMGDELDEQNELLTDVESGVDHHQSTLDRARRRLGNVARKSKGNWSWITIGILICVLLLLIIVLK
ncbi:hypothetical protein B0A48_09811 [Cryoendolithus antarcticus]|uniref:t-SNARE coiled-coil homology domain-containing protein n=1 Tax=Cryoendolithus antarcticus TaxID=1507870 RepID=A0A1V8T3C3_9PEZI|nr:hypothetical protein B0A48_09811 [Cryoendolithus antarcticus]